MTDFEIQDGGSYSLRRSLGKFVSLQELLRISIALKKSSMERKSSVSGGVLIFISLSLTRDVYL